MYAIRPVAFLSFPSLKNMRTADFLDTDKQPSKTKRCPYLHSAACRNVCSLAHNEVQGIMTFYMLGVKLSLAGATGAARQSRTLLCTAQGEGGGFGSWEVSSSLAWDGCWRWLLASPTGSRFAAMGLRNSKQGDKLSSTLTPAVPHWPFPHDGMATTGTSLVAVQARAAKEPE